MGLDDRDYMRERNRRTFDRMLGDRDQPFTPPRETSLLVMILWWVLIGLVLWKGFQWWEQKQAAQRAVAAAAAQEHARRAAEAQHAAALERAAALQRARIEREQRAAHSTDAAPVQPQGASLHPAAPGTPGTIYLCKAYDGRSFWAQAHCSQHRALIDSLAPVPAGLPFDEQVRIAQDQRRAVQDTLAQEQQRAADLDRLARERRRAVEQAAYSSAGPAGGPSPAVNTQAECKWLDAHIEQLDAMARQPQSAQTQDWIRGERKQARDRQFRIRC